MDLEAEVGEDFDLDGLDTPEVEVEEAAEVEASPEEVESTEYESLDVDAYGNHLVTVVVDGEERQVPLTELRGGYQRQADYTRKTQELATQRQEAQSALALMAAFRQDPEGTLAVLAQESGIDFSRPVSEANPELSPLEQRLARMEQVHARQQVDAEVAHLTSELGDLFDPSEAVAHALRERVTITQAAKQLAADKLLAERVKGAVKAQRQAEDDSRTAAKRNAQVAGGHGAKGGKATLNPNDLSTAELFDAIEKGLIK